MIILFDNTTVKLQMLPKYMIKAIQTHAEIHMYEQGAMLKKRNK